MRGRVVSRTVETRVMTDGDDTTKLLVAANISDVKPNQFTRKMAHYARDVFSPRGIEYKYTRTEQKRLFEFFHDDDDGDDDDIDISELFHWGIPQTSSSSSASSLRLSLIHI